MSEVAFVALVSQEEVASYRKVDVISKEEFDNQRGTEEPREMESADSEMVFALDLPETGKSEVAAVSKPREGEKKGEGGRVSPSKAHPQPPKVEKEEKGENKRGKRPLKPEKKARFYPLPDKKESSEQVGGDGESFACVAVVLSTALSACMIKCSLSACVTTVGE